MRRVIGFVALVVFTGFWVTGCGPVQYVSQVTTRAASAVAAARSVGAARYAPYDYTSAVEYLHKAREEAGHADFQAANRFGRLAEQHANNARKIALERAGRASEGTP